MTYDATLDPLEEVEKVVDDLRDIIDRRNLGKALELACRRLDEESQSLERLSLLLDVIPLVGPHLQGVQRETVTSHLQQLWSLGAQASAATTRDELDSLTREVKRVKEALKEVERFLLDAWQRRTAVEFSSTSALGTVLKDISDGDNLFDIGEMMAQACKQGTACAKSLPVLASSREQFKDAVTERDTAYTLLQDSGADGDVIAFLNAVASKEATLQHLTPNVQDWLKGRNALHRFFVSL